MRAPRRASAALALALAGVIQIGCGTAPERAASADVEALLATFEATRDTTDGVEIVTYAVPANVGRERVEDSTVTSAYLTTVPSRREALGAFGVRYRGASALSLSAVELEVGSVRVRLPVDTARRYTFVSRGEHTESSWFAMDGDELERVLAQLDTASVGVVRLLGTNGRIEHRLTSWERIGLHDVHRAYRALRSSGYKQGK